MSVTETDDDMIFVREHHVHSSGAKREPSLFAIFDQNLFIYFLVQNINEIPNSMIPTHIPTHRHHYTSTIPHKL